MNSDLTMTLPINTTSPKYNKSSSAKGIGTKNKKRTSSQSSVKAATTKTNLSRTNAVSVSATGGLIKPTSRLKTLLSPEPDNNNKLHKPAFRKQKSSKSLNGNQRKRVTQQVSLVLPIEPKERKSDSRNHEGSPNQKINVLRSHELVTPSQIKTSQGNNVFGIPSLESPSM